MPLISCETNLSVTCSRDCFIAARTANNQEPRFMFNVPVEALSSQDYCTY